MKLKTNDIDAKLETKLKKDKSIAKRILDALELELRNCSAANGALLIWSKKSKVCLFSNYFLDAAGAALVILKLPRFYIDFSKHIVNNPLYGCKCIEEILVKLDLLEDTKNYARAGANDET